MKASDLLVKCLETEGVKYVFGLPGEENEDLLFSLERSNIRFIPTRHEQGAAFMADVWGRLTGKAGVCLSTLGPGATNLITGLADAHLDKSPVVAITGQAATKRLHKESHQSIDIVNMFKPITKWNASVQNPNIIPEVVRKAFKISQMEKPGVAHIELPEDVAALDVDLKPLLPQVVRRPAPDYKAIEQLLSMLKRAKRPLILAGNGAIRKLASKHLRLLVSKLNLPVVSTFMGKGAVSDRDDHSLFSIGLKGRDFNLCALEAADLIITVGYDIGEYDPANWNTAKHNIVHIDFLPAETDENYEPDLEIVADISATLWEISRQAQAESLPPFPNWYLPVRKAFEQDLLTYQTDKHVTVPKVLALLRGSMRDDDIIISDVGAHKMWLGRNFKVYEPGSCVISNGFASMGIALPGAIAAKLAYPEKHVVAVMGDGGFLMNSQEIETAQRLKLGFTMVVLNDNDYGLISWKQQVSQKRTFGTILTNPDFVKYAESFGIKAVRPKTLEEINQALTEAVNSSSLNLIAIDIDPKVNLELTNKLESNLCANFNLKI